TTRVEKDRDAHYRRAEKIVDPGFKEAYNKVWHLKNHDPKPKESSGSAVGVTAVKTDGMWRQSLYFIGDVFRTAARAGVYIHFFSTVSYEYVVPAPALEEPSICFFTTTTKMRLCTAAASAWFIVFRSCFDTT
ncbi:unnamed protein product, partial [Pylaiella littoralis]